MIKPIFSFTLWIVLWVGSLLWLYLTGTSLFDILLLTLGAAATAMIINTVMNWAMLRIYWKLHQHLQELRRDQAAPPPDLPVDKRHWN